MSTDFESPSPPDKPLQPAPADIYHIRVRGRLEGDWFRDWFDGFTIRNLVDSGDSLISGPVRDQAELFALLSRLRDAGLRLISLDCSPADGIRGD